MTKIEKRKILEEYQRLYPEADIKGHSLPICSRCLSIREGVVVSGQIVCFQCIKEELRKLGIIIKIVSLTANKKKVIVYTKNKKEEGSNGENQRGVANPKET